MTTRTRSPRPTRWIGMLNAPKPSLAQRPAAHKAAPHYFFVACAANDYAVAIRPLIDAAELDGHRFWIEHRHPRGAEEIAAAVDGCAGLIVFCSEESLTALSLYRQVARAAQAGKPIVPVSLDGARLPDALLFYLSEAAVIDATQQDWRMRINAALDRMDGGRRREFAPAAAVFDFPEPSPPAPLVPVGAPARRRSMSHSQRFVNAFAAGAMALFAFAMLDLTGGPPTGREIENVAVKMQEAAEEVVLSTPI